MALQKPAGPVRGPIRRSSICGRSARSSAVLAGISLIGLAVAGQEIEHLAVPHRGGMPGIPVITGIQNTTNGTRITWDGPSGYYQLLRKLSMEDPAWKAVGPATNLSRRATISAIHERAFFQITGPAPRYAGAQACLECHENLHHDYTDTRHAGAFEALRRIGQDKNPNCLPCHTVGFGLPSGFVSELATPHLAGVQCESCHGPAGNHAAQENDPLSRPRLEIASQVCGGCHTGSHQPQFDEWKTSGHAQVVEDMNPANRIQSCGRCHSGSVRLSLLKGGPLPAGDANMGVVCVTCHDPHKVTGNPAQLRNPVASTNDYVITTSGDFLSQYDPKINLCAQCHNHRGASWNSSARPPHHSLQYNMLLGTIGELGGGAAGRPARHATLEKQCVSCHMQTGEYKSETEPEFSGHTFKVERFEACRACHPLPELLAQFSASAIAARVEQIKEALDSWAASKAPSALRAKYGTRSWEYTNPGELSTGGPGPNASEQALIPERIKKARFNLYVVLYDGSRGAHNGPHSIALLDAAREWVREESKQ